MKCHQPGGMWETQTDHHEQLEDVEKEAQQQVLVEQCHHRLDHHTLFLHNECGMELVSSCSRDKQLVG